MDPEVYNDLIKKIEGRGYSLDKLYKVPQKEGS